MAAMARKGLILALILTWVTGLSAWAADFDTLQDLESVTAALAAHGGDPCAHAHADHCEHGMSHWIGLPPSLDPVAPEARPDRLAHHTPPLRLRPFAPEPQPPRV